MSTHCHCITHEEPQHQAESDYPEEQSEDAKTFGCERGIDVPWNNQRNHCSVQQSYRRKRAKQEARDGSSNRPELTIAGACEGGQVQLRAPIVASPTSEYHCLCHAHVLHWWRSMWPCSPIAAADPELLGLA